MTRELAPAVSPATGMQRTVRRLVVFTLLFVLVVIAASGAANLLGRLLGAGSELVAGDVTGLAQGFAFLLVGGPLALALWWSVWRRLGEPSERSSLAWGLYASAMYVVSMIVAATSLLSVLSDLVAGRTVGWGTGIAGALVWGGVWIWHRWMWLHPAKGPVRLAEVPTVGGTVYGLVIGTGGAVTGLALLFDTAAESLAGTTAVGKPWWVLAVQALLWAAAGVLLWWWHWFRQAGLRLHSGLADVALVVTGILGACVLAVAGWGTLLFVLLRLAFDRSEPAGELLGPLGFALAAGTVGTCVWIYHRGIAAGRTAATREAARLVVCGVALAAAATGVGVVVNSLLAITGSALAGTSPRTLLLGGISALAVGGPLWWRSWRPGKHGRPDGPEGLQEPAGRKVYLIIVFGVSAVVALVTLLVIGYRVFELLLDGTTPGSLVDRIRAPFGLLAATGLAAGYHYSVWRHERPAGPSQAPGGNRGISRILLVAAGDPEPWLQAAKELTGARVTVWRRSPTGTGLEADAVPEQPEPAAARLERALDGVSAARILVIAGPEGRLEVIGLEG
ncbi:hypothetical protein D477_008993 [Arthrobacter crystallopoietes BAB-32]|uniref:DUF5671 domain-containing protein n=1 Tax=Arthrobacter crystallopoietes BAB-32 TaxID=1246476 RepID=N1V8F1_9MICC|nr:DUF5671 domain-containing protein [Arthrobacter crystallopoietes]EMY34533.1 hypothetical protein D477_008993 [Arthrobacter crystallopoietes BAB-32]